MNHFGSLYREISKSTDENDELREKKDRIKELENSEYGLNGVGIEIVNSRCQLKCGFCFAGRNNIENMEDGIGKEIAIKRRDSPDMTFEQVKGIVDQAVEIGAKEIYFIGAGETTLHPQLPEMLRYTRDRLKEKNKNDFLMVAATNGIKLMDEKYCKELVETEAIIFPHFYVLGTGDEEIKILSEVIGKPLEQTKKIAEKQEKGRKNLIKFSREKYGDLSRVAFDHCLVPPTVRSGQTKKVFEYCTELGVKKLFFEMARTSCGIQRDSQFLLPLNEYKEIYDELYKLIPEDERKPMTPPAINRVCDMPKTGVHIITSGDVLPCCGTYFLMGNIFETPLEEILKNPIRNRFRHYRNHIAGHCRKCEDFKPCGAGCMADKIFSIDCADGSAAYCTRIENNLTPKDAYGSKKCKTCDLKDYGVCRQNGGILSSPIDGKPYKIKGILKGGN